MRGWNCNSLNLASTQNKIHISIPGLHDNSSNRQIMGTISNHQTLTFNLIYICKFSIFNNLHQAELGNFLGPNQIHKYTYFIYKQFHIHRLGPFNFSQPRINFTMSVSLEKICVSDGKFNCLSVSVGRAIFPLRHYLCWNFYRRISSIKIQLLQCHNTPGPKKKNWANTTQRCDTRLA